MPELPEVETTILELKKIHPPIIGVEFFDIWSDFPKIVKKPKKFSDFKKEILGKKIVKIWRRGKNILLDLSSGKTLLIHQKLTGHLLFGRWEKKNNLWLSKIPGPLADDPTNKFLHLIFTFKDGRQLALSDLRKFAIVEILSKEELEKKLSLLGPEPLNKKFTFKKFKETLFKKEKLKIKQVLMDQEIIAGIGNIYSDEILWEAKIHPFRNVNSLSNEEIKKIYSTMKKILKKAIKLGGESISDFRRISGEKGNFDKERKVYRREKEKCLRCGFNIQRKKIGGRSTYFCPICQKL